MMTAFESRRYLTDFDVSRTGNILTDILVVGSGVAGARAAIEAARHADVIIITKEAPAESISAYAQGGIAGAVAMDDSYESHAEDTIRVGAGLNDPEIVKLTVEEGPDRIRELREWGIRFDSSGADVDLTMEGGHRHRRILHSFGDATGKEISRGLLAKVQEHDNIRIFDHCFLIDLITIEGRCMGAVTYHSKYGHQLIWAGQTIVASGGCGRIFRETSNPPIATGDACAVAWRAGATLRDMEMIQFHPTTLYIAGASRALISEAVRGEGAYLVDRNGDRFMFNYHPDGELAPRDIVSLSIQKMLKETGATSAFLDVRHIGKKTFTTRFPSITRHCEEFGIDVGKDLIPVRPAAHYMIGGIAVDASARTDVEGLLCCGEASNTRLHGANRLASNSLLEALVFGKIAGRVAGESLREIPEPAGIRKIQNVNPDSDHTQLDLGDIRNSLRSLMWRNVGIARTGDLLRETIEIIEFWGRFVMDKVFDDISGWETQNMLTIGCLIASAAGHRNESRGVHYRLDFPPDTRNGGNSRTQDLPYHLIQQKAAGHHVATRIPV